MIVNANAKRPAAPINKRRSRVRIRDIGANSYFLALPSFETQLCYAYRSMRADAMMTVIFSGAVGLRHQRGRAVAQQSEHIAPQDSADERLYSILMSVMVSSSAEP
jgi:hypothetical protein